MKKTDRYSLIAFPIELGLGALMAVAGSHGGAAFGGFPLFALCVGLTFVIQWIAFVPAYLLQTEAFFDLTGSLTYIVVISGAAALGPSLDSRSLLVTALVVVWAARLGGFLFTRMRIAGKDDRFDEIKPSFIRFFNVWTIQAVWVTFTVSAALVTVTTNVRKDLDAFAIAGALVWMAGFGIESVADAQKRRFNADPVNRGRFIQSGLWSRSRHPNYFGEIVLWVGVAIIALPVLRGWQWAALSSPVFVTLLLTRVSGVPGLEAKADRKWGGQQDFEAYKRRTPVLILRLR